jgi:hypothetical protein
MKNMPKYIDDDVSNTFSADFLQKVFMGAFVWKNMCHDVAKSDFIRQRRKALRAGENEEYKKIIKLMNE